MKLFSFDSPFMHGLETIADLMWLNFLTVLCCLPVITAGASLTAMHYMALKIVRDEHSHITAGFFRAFLDNFKQSTIIWLLLLVVMAILGTDIYLTNRQIVVMPKLVVFLTWGCVVLLLFELVYVFAVQAKFANTIPKTMQNAFFLSILQFPKTVIMLGIYAVMVIFLLSGLLPIVLLFGISAPIFIHALLYNKVFQKLEQQILEAHAQENGGTDAAQEDERIFHDQVE